MGAKKVSTYVNWRCKYEASPSSANVGELVPPMCALPMEFPYREVVVVLFVPDIQSV
jgi:hypothetical protein